MNYQWADGFRPPKNVTADDVKAAIDALPEPSPDRLLQASKRKTHVLYDDLWSEGDQVWAQRARLDRCRHILSAIHETIIVGGKSMSIRAVEFLKTNGEGAWVKIEDIRRDPALLDAYFAEVQRLSEQAAAKMAKARELMHG